jgi:hypothetical protein
MPGLKIATVQAQREKGATVSVFRANRGLFAMMPTSSPLAAGGLNVAATQGVLRSHKKSIIVNPSPLD